MREDYPDRDIYLVTIHDRLDSFGNPTRIWVKEPDATVWAEESKKRPNVVTIKHQTEVGS